MKRPIWTPIWTMYVAIVVAVCFLACPEKKVVPPAKEVKPTQVAPVKEDPKSKLDDYEYTVAVSIWTGWMPFKIMEQKGFLKKRADQFNVKIRVKWFKGYMDTVNAYAAEQVDGVAMTNMEALQPASKGIKSVAVLINDISNGGDGILVKKSIKGIKDLKGKTIRLEEFSVSHYLLARALELNGLKEKEVKVANMSGDDAGKAFMTDNKVDAVATWNPWLFQGESAGKGHVIFNSTKIPNEIIDLLVVRQKSLAKNPNFVKAVVAAWYDAMAFIEDEKTKEEAIGIMAKEAGASVEDFKKMLLGTILYTKKEMSRNFLSGDLIKETMKKVKDFCISHNLLGKNPKVSVNFGDYKATSADLTFDPQFIE